MKKTIFLLAAFAFLACKKESQEPFEKPTETTKETYSEGETAATKSPEELGKEIFEGKGNCTSCHQPDQKIIGPSIKEIAKTYKDKNADIVTFLKGNGEPIVDPSQFAVMKTNFPVTKAMSDEELKAVESYIYSHLK
ncbi:cytochrome C552 [Flavobacterium cheongpyeongense]|jgi:cytochrome c|uniref:Cytochrome C552 n=1 Tax=Flavobacterium cheongpyeongense TaxID=2212651 RepID=A0A2V4BM07_9FLAO|nr:c-type cytochrome [Flavobacterium cheongpyeongense]PXY39995.1 cytochrome C552 [Flavobacterium cheongpyeongense]